MKRAFCILALLYCVLSPISAQTVDDAGARRKRLQEEISVIDNRLKSNRAAQKATSGDLTLIQKKISSRKALLGEMDRQIGGYARDISSKEREIAGLKAEHDTLEKYYSNLVYSLYKNRDPKIQFMYVAASENVGQGLRRLSYLKNISVTLREKAGQTADKAAEIELEKTRLEKLRSEAQIVRGLREDEYRTMLDDEKESRELAGKLKGDERKYRRQLEDRRREVRRLDEEIARLVSSTIKSDKQDNTTDYVLSGKFGQNRGKLPWPVEKAVVIEKYGQHNHPVYKNVKLPFNNGVNILAGGSPDVRCVFDGKVKQILVMPGYNRCVLVQHGTYFTFYCKLGEVSVKNGQTVKAGQIIGRVAKDGDERSVLHFQIWNGTEKQNPETWLR